MQAHPNQQLQSQHQQRQPLPSTIASFNLATLYKGAQMGFYFSNLRSILQSSHTTSHKTSDIEVASSIMVYQMKKKGWKFNRFRIERKKIDYFVVNKERKVTIYIPGMKPNCPIHYGIISDALLVPNELIQGRVHRGFLSVFAELWPSLHQILRNIADANSCSITELKLELFGHSMGGALSTLLAFAAYKAGFQQVKVACFGSPRLFSPVAARTYDGAIGAQTLRITHGYEDPVTIMAPGLSGYVHIGEHLAISSGVDDSVTSCHSMLGYLCGIHELKTRPEKFKISKIGILFSKLVSPVRWAQEMTIGGLQMMFYEAKAKMMGSGSKRERKSGASVKG